jgi:hypothetical protein
MGRAAARLDGFTDAAFAVTLPLSIGLFTARYDWTGGGRPAAAAQPGAAE